MSRELVALVGIGLPLAGAAYALFIGWWHGPYWWQRDRKPDPERLRRLLK